MQERERRWLGDGEANLEVVDVIAHHRSIEALGRDIDENERDPVPSCFQDFK